MGIFFLNQVSVFLRSILVFLRFQDVNLGCSTQIVFIIIIHDDDELKGWEHFFVYYVSKPDSLFLSSREKVFFKVSILQTFWEKHQGRGL